jgi:hypothetical protein
MSRRPTILIIAAALTGLLALPGAAVAAPTASASASSLVTTLATDACVAEKSEIGKKAFKKRYGAKKGMKACVKKAKPQARQAITEATDECIWELEEYGDEEFYYEWDSFTACVEDYAAWIMDGGGFEDDDEEDTESDDEDDGLF